MSGPAEVAGTSTDTGGAVAAGGTGAPGGVGPAAGPGGAAPAGGVVAARPVPLLNVANALTVIRLLLVPVFLVVLFAHGGIEPSWRWGAFAVFAIASLTDSFDGDLARRWDQVTDFGKIADPIADKALTGMAFIGLSIIGDIWWWVTILVLVREWSVTLLRLSVLKQVVIAASMSGKIKTTLQAIALSGLCLPLPHGDGVHGGEFDRFGVVGEVLFYAGQVFLAGAVAMTVWSGYEFFRDVWKQRAHLRG